MVQNLLPNDDRSNQGRTKPMKKNMIDSPKKSQSRPPTNNKSIDYQNRKTHQKLSTEIDKQQNRLKNQAEEEEEEEEEGDDDDDEISLKNSEEYDSDRTETEERSRSRSRIRMRSLLSGLEKVESFLGRSIIDKDLIGPSSSRSSSRRRMRRRLRFLDLSTGSRLHGRILNNINTSDLLISRLIRIEFLKRRSGDSKDGGVEDEIFYRNIIGSSENQDLYDRTISSVISQEHLELILPNQTHPQLTIIVQASILTSIMNTYDPRTRTRMRMRGAIGGCEGKSSPRLMIITLSDRSTRDHSSNLIELTRGLEGLSIHSLYRSKPLNENIRILEDRSSVDKPSSNHRTIAISSLERTTVLIQRGYLDLRGLTTILFDLRRSPMKDYNHNTGEGTRDSIDSKLINDYQEEEEEEIFRIDHHSLAEIESVLRSILPSVQIILMIDHSSDFDRISYRSSKIEKLKVKDKQQEEKEVDDGVEKIRGRIDDEFYLRKRIFRTFDFFISSSIDQNLELKS